MVMKFNFPKPKDKLLMIDLDETLIDRNTQQINNRNLKEAIVITQESGWRIGLSSDTPLKQLKIWKERFGMNGPTIAEKGAIVELGSKAIFASPEVRASFSSSFQVVLERLRASGNRIELGSPIEIIREDAPFGKANETVIFANNLRECSLGIFVLKTDENGRLRPNSKQTDEIAALVDPCLPKISTLAKYVNQQGGIIVASDGQIDKRRGTQLLMQELGMKQIGMIGDSIFDNVGKDIAIHYAVRNASDDFKRMSSYVASFEKASGVVEILENIRREE